MCCELSLLSVPSSRLRETGILRRERGPPETKSHFHGLCRSAGQKKRKEIPAAFLACGRLKVVALSRLRDAGRGAKERRLFFVFFSLGRSCNRKANPLNTF